MKLKNSYHIYALTTIFFWSLAFVFTRLALHHFTALSLGFFRYAIASLTLIVVALIKKIKLPKKEHLPLFLASGALGFFVYMIAFNIGSLTLTASTCSVVLAIGPILTALLASIVFKEKLKDYQWVAIGVEFAGILALTLMNGVLSINTGVIWLLSAALCVSGYNILQRKLTKIYSGLQTTVFNVFAGTLMLGIFAPLSVSEIKTAPPEQFFYVAFLGIFSSALAYVCWSIAFQKAERTSYVSNYMFLTPFVTSIFGFLIAGEIPDKATFIGGAIILSGVCLFNIKSFFPHLGEKAQVEQ